MFSKQASKFESALYLNQDSGAMPTTPIAAARFSWQRFLVLVFTNATCPEVASTEIGGEEGFEDEQLPGSSLLNDSRPTEWEFSHGEQITPAKRGMQSMITSVLNLIPVTITGLLDTNIDQPQAFSCFRYTP